MKKFSLTSIVAEELVKLTQLAMYKTEFSKVQGSILKALKSLILYDAQAFKASRL